MKFAKPKLNRAHTFLRCEHFQKSTIYTHINDIITLFDKKYL